MSRTSGVVTLNANESEIKHTRLRDTQTSYERCRQPSPKELGITGRIKSKQLREWRQMYFIFVRLCTWWIIFFHSVLFYGYDILVNVLGMVCGYCKSVLIHCATIRLVSGRTDDTKDKTIARVGREQTGPRAPHASYTAQRTSVTL